MGSYTKEFVPSGNEVFPLRVTPSIEENFQTLQGGNFLTVKVASLFTKW